MTTVTTYWIEYGNGKSAWLAPDADLDAFDGITNKEERIMLVAETGKTLCKDGNEIAPCVWLVDGDDSGYYEQDQSLNEEESGNGRE